jgi:type II secretory ATPase GspE/PulE/Tfp pilus assembly ATPase PilB-like protein
MVSSQGKRVIVKTTDKEMLCSSPSELMQSFHEEQIFHLINNFLSFEACLYHEVLPLGVDNNDLLLGMVNPEDSVAAEYARRIFSYLNFTLKTQPLEAATHQQILSNYLQRSRIPQASPQQQERLLVDENTATSQESCSSNPKSEDIEQDAILLEPYQQTTFILDDTAALQMPLPDQEEIPAQPETASLSQPNFTNSLKSQKVNTQIAISAPVTSIVTLPEDIPILELEPTNLSLSTAELGKLPARQLLAQLLGRVLVGGIGRLYFERQQQQGRILWSENGVLQSVLEEMPLFHFQELIDELKQLAGLSSETVTESKQVDIERRYQQQHLLLRLRFMPGVRGEEATLQVLQGAALKFYQQKQLNHLKRDVVTISQQLAQKLLQLQNHLQRHYGLNSQQLEAVAALTQVVESLEAQVQTLTPEVKK